MTTNTHEASAQERQLSPSQADFLAELAVCLGLSPGDGPGLQAPALFAGPGGLMCRIQLSEDEAHPSARPEVLLPVPAEELGGREVSRLLSVQALLMSELGWYLGISAEGLLQLGALVWLDTPREIATALDAANAIGPTVLQAILLDDAATASAPATP